ncbi:uncharacterized protein LOC116298720 [Actinia tenebrosa]|uniref:Uncharacterized protein LOC116298720 n=1 Tax=Actinia tenebrosa TaxID=6105 RepID=A0A6P8I3I8_ACTTE|nr:uncharacterized protein LOC116298720 [Actinia tenebrosa]
MACASSVEEKMAEYEESFVLDAPANILRYGVVEKLAMQLSINGPLVSWRNVADELGFSNLEISGHYANFAGSYAALGMLNDWIFKKNGKIRDLVQVLLSLELYGCLEDIKEDLEKYSQQSKKRFVEDKDDEGIDSSRDDRVFPSSSETRGNTSSPVFCSTEDSSFCSSGLNSLSTSYTDSSLQRDTSSPQTSLQSEAAVDSLLCPYTIEDVGSPKASSSTQKSTEMTTSMHTEHSPINRTKPLSQPRRCPSDSIIKELDWPENGNRDYERSTSVPHEKIHKTKSKSKKSRFFKRSQSLEPDTGTHKKRFLSFAMFKKNKSAKNEKTNSNQNAGTEKNAASEADTGATSATAKGFYCEQACTLKPNLSPLIVSEEKAQRPVSSSSEDSLSISPSSPASPMGYESGYHSGDNSFKRIYIVCCPEEEEVYQRALKMYMKFSQKGYECHLFATDTQEVMEVGRFRYEMQQVKHADFVFLCVSKKLKEIFDTPVRKAQAFKDEDTKGLRHVSDFMMTFFANDCCNKNGKFMTILLMEDSYNHIPFAMNSYLKYKFPEQERRMENTIHQRCEILLAPVRDAKIYPPIKVCTPKGVMKASVREDDTKG